MGQHIDCQPCFDRQVGRRKVSYADRTAQVAEKTAFCLLSDKLLGAETRTVYGRDERPALARFSASGCTTRAFVVHSEQMCDKALYRTP